MLAFCQRCLQGLGCLLALCKITSLKRLALVTFVRYGISEPIRLRQFFPSYLKTVSEKSPLKILLINHFGY
jgi:hypothetical protein